MSFIPEEIIQDIRQKTDIVAIINDYVKLTKSGTNYTASCPFHEDRNPSFSVHPGKQIYKCFSCGRGGNVFSFLQEIEGISFVEAVRKAAELSSIALDERFFNQRNDVKHQQQHLLMDLHQKVADFYHYYLMNTVNGEEAYRYLIDRGMEKQTMETYGLGLAPEQSEIIVQYLLESGFNREQLVQSGIFYQNEQGELIDRFRTRIIFPLRNDKGQVVAFSGRVFVEQQTDKKQAKYLNSPETEIFHKASLVFNLDLARQKIRQRDQVIICEGYMDVIALHQAGFEHAVATMGTSLTERHLSHLAKLAQEFVFIFDGDEAGQKATLRAFELAQTIPNLRLKSVTIPNKMDPDDWIRQKGRDSFQQLINQAISSYDFYQTTLRKQYDLSDKQQLAKYVDLMVQHIATAINSPIERELRINELSQRYQLSEDLLLEQLAHKLQHKPKSQQQPADKARHNNDVVSIPATDAVSFEVLSKRAFQSEKQLLALLMYYEEAWHFLNQLTTPLMLFHSVAQQAFFELQTHYYDKGVPLPLTNIVNYIEDPQINHFLTTLIWENDAHGYSDEIMQDCIVAIEQEFIQLQIDELRKKVSIYEKEQRYSEADDLMMTIIQLNRQLKLNRQ